MTVELTPLEAKSSPTKEYSGRDILNSLQNCRKAMGKDNQWSDEAVNRWVSRAQAHAKGNPDFVAQAAELGITITIE